MGGKIAMMRSQAGNVIEQAMKASKGNKPDAAWRLGIHRRSLYQKLTQFGIL
jgi:two-component system response regulator AtoC